MNGNLRKALAALCLTGGLTAVGGCYTYRELVDPCYPERYNYVARQSVNGHFAPQVSNGHILEQTVWNYHFDRGRDRLNAAGEEHLLHLARRRPAPDPMIYLATAQDIAYAPATPDELPKRRRDLDARRRTSIEKYLAAQTADRHLTFQVVVHDPAEVGQHAHPAVITIERHHGLASGQAPGQPTGGGGGAGVSGGGAPIPGPSGGGPPPPTSGTGTPGGSATAVGPP